MDIMTDKADKVLSIWNKSSHLYTCRPAWDLQKPNTLQQRIRLLTIMKIDIQNIQTVMMKMQYKIFQKSYCDIWSWQLTLRQNNVSHLGKMPCYKIEFQFQVQHISFLHWLEQGCHKYVYGSWFHLHKLHCMYSMPQILPNFHRLWIMKERFNARDPNIDQNVYKYD